MQLVPVQLAPTLLVVSHLLLQPAQFVIVVSAVSQPLVFGAVLLQSPKPGAQPEYEHVVAPRQTGPTLLLVSQATPHAPQLVVVLIGVSQPSRSGAVLSQSA